jgi:hypothetical protein
MAVDRQNFAPGSPAFRDQVVKVGRLVTSVAGAAAALYYFKGYDSGTAGYVTWGPYSEFYGHSSPASTETTPNYTGTLSVIHIHLIRR